MQTENYNEITIQEITDHAGLSRRTFYRNYSIKDEILEGYFNKIWLGTYLTRDRLVLAKYRQSIFYIDAQT